MDSMVNKYTANKRLRSDDAYTPDGRPDMRPEYPSIVYSQILKKLYPDVPVILGGIEASMRRLSHYDYWQDQLKKSILCESGADMLIYGMGEKPICELVRRLTTHNEYRDNTTSPFNICRSSLTTIPQIAYLTDEYEPDEQDIALHSHEECLADKKKQSANFRHIEEESNKYAAARIIQAVDNKVVVVNPPYPPMTQEELDHSFDLPYTRLPHPKYKGKRIPAYDMIKFSINIHRGCFGGCAFCTISAHQGKFIVSRSKESILKEVKEVVQLPDFKGNLSDLGGPSANMYKMGGKDLALCKRCKRPSCIHPKVCPNLNTDHRPLLDIYHAVDSLPEIKRSFIGSGVRYDLLLHQSKDPSVNKSTAEYTRELLERHGRCRLKVALEPTSARVVSILRQRAVSHLREFKKIFDRINRELGLRQQLIPYFISSHPGCREEDMAELAVITKRQDFHLEQVQDFTQRPMTVDIEFCYTGVHPYSFGPVFIGKIGPKTILFFFYFGRTTEHDK